MPITNLSLNNCDNQLESGLTSMGLALSAQQKEQLLLFLSMIVHWNEHFNLTAVRSPQEMVRRHLLDSLSVLPYLHGQNILDVGTGAGLPGIPLSIADPLRNYYLLDSSQKKQIFVSQVIQETGLKNAYSIHAAVETYQPTQKFSTILTRAFAPLPRMIALTKHLLVPEGRFLAMIGKVKSEELEGVEVEEIVTLNVPEESAERHLAILTLKG